MLVARSRRQRTRPRSRSTATRAPPRTGDVSGVAVVGRGRGGRQRRAAPASEGRARPTWPRLEPTLPGSGASPAIIAFLPRSPVAHQTIIVLDFGSQFTQLIARRLRELSVYSEILPFNTPIAAIRAKQPGGIILSGGPSSVREDGAPRLRPGSASSWGCPTLGICYGMQLMTDMLGGTVGRAPHREFGHALVTRADDQAPLFADVPDELRVWASHGDFVAAPPPGFAVTATSANAPVAAMEVAGPRLLRAAVPSRGRAHRSRQRHPAQLRLRHLRLHRRLDDRVVHRRSHRADPRRRWATGRVVCGLSRRRRLDGRRDC